MERLEQLLTYIIMQLVEDPNGTTITSEEKNGLITFKVHVSEMGKVIGRNGMTASAIRGVMQAAGVKDNLNVNIEFID